jgi:hypothetical protein
MMNGLTLSSEVSLSSASSSSSSSERVRRSGVKNSANVAPRLHRSVAGASYVRGPNRSSGARYGLFEPKRREG